MTPLCLQKSKQNSPKGLACLSAPGMRVLGYTLGIFVFVLGFNFNSWGQCALNPDPSGTPLVVVNIDLGASSTALIDQAALNPDVAPVNPGCSIYLEDPNNPGVLVASLTYSCDGSTMLESGDIINVYSDDDGVLDGNTSSPLQVQINLNDPTAPTVSDPGVGPYCGETVALTTSDNWEFIAAALASTGDDEGDCSADLTWSIPEFDDNCMIDSFSITFSNGANPPTQLPTDLEYGGNSGNALPVFTDPTEQITATFYGNAAECPDPAETIVRYAVYDDSGNELITCSFTVTVEDDEIPTWDDPATPDDPSDVIETNLSDGLVDVEWIPGSSRLEVVLNCNDPDFGTDFSYLFATSPSPIGEGTFVPDAFDNCSASNNIDIVAEEPGQELPQDCTDPGDDVTVDGTSYNPYVRYRLRWTAEDECDNIAENADRFKLFLYVIDEVGPYLDPDSTGVTGPTSATLTSPGVFEADTLELTTSGTYANTPNNCGITIDDNILLLDGVDCQNITYSWELTISVDCDGAATGLAGLTGSTGDPVADEGGSLFLPVGFHTFVYEATDDCGNVSTYTIVVEVIDDTPPVFVDCPGDTVLNNVSGICEATHTWLQPSFADSCELDNVVFQIFDPEGEETIVPFITSLPDSTSANPACPNVVDFTGDYAEAEWNDDDNGGNGSFAFSPDNSTLNLIEHTGGGSRFTDGPDIEVFITIPNDGVISLDWDYDEPNSGADGADSESARIEFNGTSIVFVVNDASGSFIIPVTAGDELRFINDGAQDGSASTLTITNFQFLCANDAIDITTFAGPTLATAIFPVGVSEVRYTATDVKGNVSTCSFTVEVKDVDNPEALTQNITAELDADGNVTVDAIEIDAGSTDNCSGLTYAIALDVSPTDTIPDMMPDTALTFSCADTGDVNVVLVVTDASGNADTAAATITVVDILAPNVVTQAFTAVLDANGMVTVTVDDINDGSTDNCGIKDTVVINNMFTCDDVGVNTVFLQATDAAGNVASEAATVTVVDNQIPTANCVGDFSIQLNSAGNASIDVDDIDNNSTDNCPLGLTIDNGLFDCTLVGPNVVTLTAEDGSGNTATCSVTVTVEDNTPPTALCQDVTVELNAGGMASVTGTALNGGSTDNCGILSFSPSQSNFTCDDLGDNEIILTVTDSNTNIATCTATVTVQDNIDPDPTCIGTFTLELDSDGNATLTPEDLLNGSIAENCALVDTTLSQSSFNCTDLGNTVVSLEVEDEAGNTGECSTLVTIVDNEAPTALCVGDFTIALDDVAGEANITVADIDNGSEDNCGFALGFPSIDVSNFTCANVGPNVVTLTVQDIAGNTTTCTTTVTVEDDTNPTAECADVTVELDENGVAILSGQQVGAASSDNCGIDTLIVSPNNFDCDDIGPNTTTLLVLDLNGNPSTCIANVLVADNVEPEAICNPSVSVILDSDGNGTLTAEEVDNGSTDNCTDQANLGLSIDDTDFNCFDVGSGISVTLTVTDGSGNTAQCNSIVNVLDNELPTVSCQDITITLDDGGNATIGPEDVTQSSDDNCGIETSSVTPNSFDCDNVGNNTVTLTVTDPSGNTATCTATVTVEDNSAPTLVFCPGDITVEADAVDEDDCGAFVNYELPQFADNCTSAGSGQLVQGPPSGGFFGLGSTTVRYSYTDAGGTTIFCEFTVTVEDNTPPTITLSTDTVMLNAEQNCEVQIANYSEYVDITVDDNCPNPTFSAIPPAPVTFGLGVNAVEVLAEDGSGNTSRDTFYVVVKDDIPPIVSCQDHTAILSVANVPADNGTGSVSVDAGLNVFQIGAADENCGIESKLYRVGEFIDNEFVPFDGPLGEFQQVHTFTCTEVGTHDVEYKVTDLNGNEAICFVEITILDTDDPTAICKDITVELDENGDVTVDAADVDNGSFDNCGFGFTIRRDDQIGGFSSQLALDCDDEEVMLDGSVPVTLRVTDDSNNFDECSATITVQDNIAPDLECADGYLIVDGLVPGVNVANQGVGAAVVDVEGLNGGNPLQGTDLGSGCAQDFFPAGLLCDEDPNTDEMMLNTKSNNNSGPLWDNDTPGDSEGLLVIDLGAPYILDKAAVFQMFADDSDFDAKLDYIEIYAHPDFGTTPPPPAVDNGWALLNSGSVGAGTQVDANTVGDPEIFTFAETETRYVLILVKNSGSEDYIGIRNLKLFTPVINLENTIEVFTDEDVCTSEQTLVHPPSSDNCDVVSYTVSFTNGDDTETFDVDGSEITYTFGIGITTVEYVATDKAGNPTDCSFEILVIDNEDPVIECPENVEIGTSNEDNEGDCLGDYTWTHPSPSDNCDDDLTVTVQIGDDSPMSATPGEEEAYAFDLGTTTVTYTVTDDAGNSTTCSFTVTVEDDEMPSILNMPMDTISLPVVNNTCENIVTWTRPSFGDNCNDLSLLTITEEISDPGVQASINLNYPFNPNGAPTTPLAEFSVGTTVVKYTAVDENGNVAVDSFVVIIVDNDPPAFNNCVDDEIPACPGAIVKPYIDIVDIEDCSLEVSFQVPAPGQTLADILDPDDIVVGNSFEVKIYAVDIFGNQDSCVITVTLSDEDVPEPLVNPLSPVETECDDVIVEAPIATNCNGDVIYGIPIGLDPDLFEEIQEDPSIYVFTFNGTENVVWLYSDPITGNTATQTQEITNLGDITDPVIACPESDDICEGLMGPFAVSAWDYSQTPSSNGSIDLSDAPDTISLTGADFGTCISGVTTEENLCITVPVSGMISFNWSYISTDSDPDADPFGYSLNGTFTQLVDGEGGLEQSGNAMVMVNAGDEFCFSLLSVEACDGAATASFYDFAFKGYFTETTDPGVCTYTFGDDQDIALSYGDIDELMPGEYADGCDDADQLTVEYTLSGATELGPVEGANAGVETFNHGFTYVTYTVTDRAGNSTSCTILVKVKDNEAPTFDVAALDTLVNCDEIPPAVKMEVSDNCVSEDLIELTFVETIGDPDPECPSSYQIERKWIATDTCGNVDSLIQILTVQDTTPPSFVDLPSMIMVPNDVGFCGAEITFDLSQDDAVDNCSDTLIYTYVAYLEDGAVAFENPDTVYFPVDTTIVEYTVTDNCGNSLTETVTIVVSDTEPPLLGCINNVSFALPPSSVLTIQPNQLVQVLDDNCSANANIQLSLSQSVFDCDDATNTPIPVTITAEDEAGNISTCVTEVIIQENVPPNAVCKDITVQLDFNGEAFIDPVQLNGGSTDNCGGDLIFTANQTSFDCADLGVNDVFLTVEDASGNIDNCLAKVTVEDNVQPIANCAQFTAYLDETGSVNVAAESIDDGSSDNCTDADDLIYLINGLPSISYDCSQRGLNTVLFTVEDEQGYKDTCFTQILIVDTIPPMAICKDTILYLDANGTVSLDAEDLDNGSTDVCDDDNIFFFFGDDEGLTFDCNFIGMNIIPFVAEDDNGNRDTCEVKVTVLPQDTIEFLVADISGPTGSEISIPVTVENFFKVRSFQFSGEILDTAVAQITGITPYGAIASGANFNSSFNGNVFSVSWFDTPALDLADGDTIFTVQADVVGMEDQTTQIVLGDTPLPREVTQGCGVVGQETPAILGDPATITVDEFSSAIVSGMILTEDGQGLGNVLVQMISVNGTDTVYTDSTGYYEYFIGVGVDLTVLPTYDTDDYLNGVSTADASIIQSDLVNGNSVIMSPYRRIAGDVNGNEELATSDASLIQAVLVGNLDEFITPSWVFVDAAYMFPGYSVPDMVNVWPYPAEILIPNIFADQPNTDFVAVKMGNVVGTVAVDLTSAADDRNGSQLTLVLDDQKAANGQTIAVPFRAADLDELHSFQFTLDFNDRMLTYTGMEAGALNNFSPASIGLSQADAGKLAIGWYNGEPVSTDPDEVLFTLFFEAKADVPSLQSLFTLTNEVTEIEAFNSAYQFMDVVLGIEAVTNTNTLSEDQFVLYQNRPNPFSGMTSIGFKLDKQGEVRLTVLDQGGRVVLERKDVFNKGYQEFVIEENDLPAAGIYYYRVETDEHQATLNMILTK